MDGAPSARILLRGMLDNLNAQILYMEAQSSDKGYISNFISNLEKIRSVVIKLQEAEINGTVLDEEEAMLEMDLLGHEFFVYKDMDTNQVCVLYKRKDGNYGLIETR